MFSTILGLHWRQHFILNGSPWQLSPFEPCWAPSKGIDCSYFEFQCPAKCQLHTAEESLNEKISFHFRFFNSCRHLLSLNWTFQHDSIEKGWFLLARFQQNNCVCCLASHFTSISGTCFFEANHHGRSAPQLHSCHSVPRVQGTGKSTDKRYFHWWANSLLIRSGS